MIKVKAGTYSRTECKLTGLKGRFYMKNNNCVVLMENNEVLSLH